MTGVAPDTYEADVDEMTAGQLAVLAELRRRVANGPHSRVVETIDQYAAELVDEILGDGDD